MGSSIESSSLSWHLKDCTAFKDIGFKSCSYCRRYSTKRAYLPLYPTMSLDEVDLVCDSIYKILKIEREIV